MAARIHTVNAADVAEQVERIFGTAEDAIGALPCWHSGPYQRRDECPRCVNDSEGHRDDGREIDAPTS